MINLVMSTILETSLFIDDEWIVIPQAFTLCPLFCDTCRMDQRNDRIMAVQVDLAVNIAAVFGTAAGVISLRESGVPPVVIQRVLIECGPRRGSLAILPFDGEPKN